MKIGIFSKIDMAGGSEFRCAELANSIAKFTKHEAFFLAEKDIPDRIQSYIDDNVTCHKHIFLPNPHHLDILYEMDVLVVVNTDSRCFATDDYWLGRSERHGTPIDLSRIKNFVFLFNFLVSPARHLYTIERHGPRVKIITTNSGFFEEISKQDRYEQVRHFPRLRLESPINAHLYSREKSQSQQLRIGMHSKPVSNKWNEDWPRLIEKSQMRLGDKISFDLMGVHDSIKSDLKDAKNVTIRKENDIPVRDFLAGIDVFAFLLSWKREEPWARVVGEAMMSSCPIIATDKGGNRDQIVHGNNGFLCNDLNGFFKAIVFFAEKPEFVEKMARNSRRLAENFRSEKVIERFIDFARNE